MIEIERVECSGRGINVTTKKMQIVIEMSEQEYESMKNASYKCEYAKYILRGEILPKGHEIIINENELHFSIKYGRR